MQVGLSLVAMDIIGWLQGRSDFDFDRLNELSEQFFESKTDDSNEEPNFTVRGDGVITKWE